MTQLPRHRRPSLSVSALEGSVENANTRCGCASNIVWVTLVSFRVLPSSILLGASFPFRRSRGQQKADEHAAMFFDVGTARLPQRVCLRSFTGLTFRQQGTKNTSEADDADLVPIVEVPHAPEAS